MSNSMQAISARRRSKDRIATWAINAAGWATVALIVLILGYLLLVAMPLGKQAAVGPPEFFETAPDSLQVLSPLDGSLRSLDAPPIQQAIAADDLVLVVADGVLRVYQLQTMRDAEVPEAGDILIAELTAEDIDVDSARLAVDGAKAVAVYRRANGKVVVLQFAQAELRWRLVAHMERNLGDGFSSGPLLVRLKSNDLIVVNGNSFQRWGSFFSSNTEAEFLSGGHLTGVSADLQLVALGPGDETLLAVDALGLMHRFDASRGELTRLGDAIKLPFVPKWLLSEAYRRVSYAIGVEGQLQIIQPASGEILLSDKLDAPSPAANFAISDDAKYLLRSDRRGLARWSIDSPYPESGWRSLWGLQWLAGYDSPSRTWHPDGEAVGVLSKFNLSPLFYGTFKAAIYGMVVAVPLALGAAVYVGYFLSSRRRNQLKPSLEMLEAFPTVVLGFVAGVWLAPMLGDYLALFLLLPVVLFAVPLLLSIANLLVSRWIPGLARRPLRVGLVSVGYLTTIIALLSIAQEPALRQQLNGLILSDLFSLHYDQRNAVLVGMVMGVAIMPTMFTIVEDAINAVPRPLSDGSLALGATRWQTLSLVVLPAASPAILSALLIGFARGLGETMIVLLATGNMPIMDASPFTGLRSLSATIAIELPEAGTDSTHFRLLFLAALVLFALTFVLNTVAELFRQRLRYAYAHANH